MPTAVQKFQYKEDLLVELLNECLESGLLSYQTATMEGRPIGEAADPAKQAKLDKNWEHFVRLSHLSFAGDMGLLELEHVGTKEKPSARDINGEPLYLIRWRLTYRGKRYLEHGKLYRWLLRHHHEHRPLLATFRLLVALVAFLVALCALR